MYPTISMRELEQWIQNGRQMTLIDVRDRCSYEQGHLEGAVCIPYVKIEEILETGSGTLRQLEPPLVLYCARGSLSMLACNLLSKKGYRVVNVGGGLMAYCGVHMQQCSGSIS